MSSVKFDIQRLDEMRIGVFVRHGESTKNAERIFSSAIDKYPLTPKGLWMSETAAIELASLFHINGFYTSPVLRARETAKAVSERINLSALTNDLLRERSNGRYEEYKYAPGEEYALLDEQMGMGYPDFESWGSLIERMGRFSRLIKNGEIVLAVTHGDPIKAAVARALEMNEGEIMESIGKWYWPECSITIIDFEKTGSEALLANGSMMLPLEFRGMRK